MAKPGAPRPRLRFRLLAPISLWLMLFGMAPVAAAALAQSGEAGVTRHYAADEVQLTLYADQRAIGIADSLRLVLSVEAPAGTAVVVTTVLADDVDPTKPRDVAPPVSLEPPGLPAWVWLAAVSLPQGMLFNRSLEIGTKMVIVGRMIRIRVIMLQLRSLRCSA